MPIGGGFVALLCTFAVTTSIAFARREFLGTLAGRWGLRASPQPPRAEFFALRAPVAGGAVAAQDSSYLVRASAAQQSFAAQRFALGGCWLLGGLC